MGVEQQFVVANPQELPGRSATGNVRFAFHFAKLCAYVTKLVFVSRATAEICDCERFTEFWVSWSELTNIAQGTGSVVTSHTINYVEDTSDPVDIHLVSLASWTTASAEWVFHESQSKLNLLPVL